MHENSYASFKVSDRKSFIWLFELLPQDFTNNPGFWENNTQQPMNADAPGWQIFADILKVAVVYE
jgi:hypothetical protein